MLIQGGVLIHHRNNKDSDGSAGMAGDQVEERGENRERVGFD